MNRTSATGSARNEKVVGRRRRRPLSRPGVEDGADRPRGVDNRGKPDAMEGFRPGPGNTGSIDGRDEVGHGQVNHKI